MDDILTEQGVRFVSQHIDIPTGGCDFTQFLVRSSEMTWLNLRADRVTVEGSALDWLVGETSDSLSLVLHAKGVVFFNRTGSGAFDYAARVQAGPGTDVDLAVEWDRTTKALTITRFDINAPGRNAIALTAELPMFDPLTFQTLPLSGSTLGALDLKVQNHGSFERTILPMLLVFSVPLFMTADDVEAKLETLKAAALLALAEMPETNISTESKAALAAFITELPSPTGTLGLSFHAAPAFDIARLGVVLAKGLPESVAAAATLYEGTFLTLTWQPEPDE